MGVGVCVRAGGGAIEIGAGRAPRLESVGDTGTAVVGLGGAGGGDEHAGGVGSGLFVSSAEERIGVLGTETGISGITRATGLDGGSGTSMAGSKGVLTTEETSEMTAPGRDMSVSAFMVGSSSATGM